MHDLLYTENLDIGKKYYHAVPLNKVERSTDNWEAHGPPE